MAKEHVIIQSYTVTYNTVGQLGSVAGNVLTLLDADDAKRCHVGMRLRAGVSPRYLRCGAFEVIGTDEDTGTVTVDWACAVTGLCSGDRLYWSASEHR